MTSHPLKRRRTEPGAAPPPVRPQRELVIASLIRCPDPATIKQGTS
jgi:hypothetical protein